MFKGPFHQLQPLAILPTWYMKDLDGEPNGDELSNSVFTPPSFHLNLSPVRRRHLITILEYLDVQTTNQNYPSTRSGRFTVVVKIWYRLAQFWETDNTFTAGSWSIWISHPPGSLVGLMVGPCTYCRACTYCW